MRMHTSRGWLFVLTMAWVASAAAQDLAGSKDHPAIQRFPNFHISDYEQHDFDGFDFELADGSTKRVEGHHWHIIYELKDGAKEPSLLQVVRNYENAFKAKGGRVIASSADAGTATLVLPSKGGGELWLGIQAYPDRIDMDIIETAAMKQEVEVSATDMAAALASAGRVALYGILFDTGKATLRPESAATIEAIATLLRTDAALRLSVEGHTDNVGVGGANLDLSKRRAEAVVAALIAKGIASSRLTATGFGDTKPVADNTTDTGRAKNRRVELVKR